MTAKYADHLPLYRQEAIFLRHGLETVAPNDVRLAVDGAPLDADRARHAARLVT
ncbi:MAG: hypothetical protein IPH13_11790 [Planctomycetes bacterium]|nr:hypothetical protein [Planctomycetota bacterium]